MRDRTLRGALLAAFVVATALQLLLHAHPFEGRHHGEDCAEAGADGSAAPGPASAAAPGAHVVTAAAHDDDGGHRHCGRCVTPAGDLRARPGALNAPIAATRELAARLDRAPFAPLALGYELRGPPRA